eukprot:4260708-Amphidinium_carterae.3
MMFAHTSSPALVLSKQMHEAYKMSCAWIIAQSWACSSKANLASASRKAANSLSKCSLRGSDIMHPRSQE